MTEERDRALARQRSQDPVATGASAFGLIVLALAVVVGLGKMFGLF